MGIGASFETPEHDVQIAQAGLAALPRLRGMWRTAAVATLFPAGI